MPKPNGRKRPNDVRTGREAKKAAQERGYEVVQGKGSHFKIKKDNATMTCYEGELSKGVARKVSVFLFGVIIVAASIALFL